MELIGKLEEVRDAIQRTATFTVREFVLEVENQRNTQWNDHILFQVSNNNVGLLDTFSVGQMIKVTFDIQGRRWTGQDGTQRVFNTLSAWRIEAAQDAATATPIQTPPHLPLLHLRRNQLHSQPHSRHKATTWNQLTTCHSNQ